MTDCSTQPTFDFYSESELRVDFEGGELSSYAGILLVRQADAKRGLTEGFARCITEWRDPLLVPI